MGVESKIKKRISNKKIDKLLKYFHLRGHTDKLYMLNFFVVICCITPVCFIIMFLNVFLDGGDMSGVVSMIEAAYAELAVFSGFVVWKAKQENIHKFKSNTHSVKSDESEESEEAG